MTNQKLYIGKSGLSKANRWRRHLRIAEGGKEKYPRLFFALHAAIKKYGQDNFSFIILEQNLSEAESFSKEKEIIRKMRNQGHQLYNLTEGGEGPSGRVPSNEARKRMSEAQRGEKSWKAKLNESKVSEIKNLLNEQNLRQQEIADKFCVNLQTINHIYKNKRWDWVEPKIVNTGPYQAMPTNSKLTIEQVREIRDLFARSSLTQKEIAQKFGVDRDAIHNIVYGKTWKKYL